MRIVFKALILLSLFAGPVYAEPVININPDHPALKMCAVLSNPTASMFVYPSTWPSIQAVPFPPYIVPGMVIGLTQNTSVVTKVCNVLNQVATLDTQNAWQGIKEITNTITDNKWKADFDQVDATYNVANNVYDFENGTYRKGAMESAETHRSMREFYKDTYSWYNKRFNGKDAEVQSRGQQEMELNQFASLASRRAILQEASNCPDPATTGNVNYEKIQKEKIEPLILDSRDYEWDMDFYKTKLLDMGVKFSNNEAEYTAYTKDLEKLVIQGVSYDITYKTKTETKQVPNPSRKDRNGKPVMDSKTIKIKTQEFQAKIFPDMYKNFKNNYGEKWSEYVKIAFMSTGNEGLLSDDPKERIENEFRDIASECNPNRLLKGVSTDRPDYNKLYDERVEKCKKDTRVSQKSSENLMNYYVEKLQSSTHLYKRAQGEMWTLQSWHLGTMRSVNTKDSTDGYQQQQVTCSEGNELSSAQMSLLANKQQEVNAELKESIAKQQAKKANLMEQKQKALAKDAEERQKKETLINQKNEANKRALDNSSLNSTTTFEGKIKVD